MYRIINTPLQFTFSSMDFFLQFDIIVPLVYNNNMVNFYSLYQSINIWDHIRWNYIWTALGLKGVKGTIFSLRGLIITFTWMLGPDKIFFLDLVESALKKGSLCLGDRTDQPTRDFLFLLHCFNKYPFFRAGLTKSDNFFDSLYILDTLWYEFHCDRVLIKSLREKSVMFFLSPFITSLFTSCLFLKSELTAIKLNICVILRILAL